MVADNILWKSEPHALAMHKLLRFHLDSRFRFVADCHGRILCYLVAVAFSASFSSCVAPRSDRGSSPTYAPRAGAPGVGSGAVRYPTNAPKFGARFETDEINLYDSGGRAVAYLAANQGLTLYLWSGMPCAYLDDDSLYGFNGEHLGWFDSGIVYDHDGEAVAAMESAFATPVQLPALKGLKQLRPLKLIKEVKPLRPILLKSWSRIPADVLFLSGCG